MKTLKKILLSLFLGGIIAMQGLGIYSGVYAETGQNTELGRFNTALEKSIDTEEINHLKNDAEDLSAEGGGANIRNFLFNKIIKVVIPVAIIMGIIFAIFGFYRVIFSQDAETTKIGFQYILYGVIGIIILMSARYITEILTSDILNTGGTSFVFDSSSMVTQLYEKIAFPFIKIIIYIALGILFVILAMQLIKYIFSTDDKAKKGAGTIISWNIIGMLIIIGSKQIIEAIYGTKEQISNQNAQSLSDVGDAILATKELPILYTIINRIMGITSLIILIIIIWQGFQLLTNPTDSNQFGKIKKSLLYIFIGILVIGAGYLITNFLIIN